MCSWNKGLNKETDERIKRQSETLKEGYKNGSIKKPKQGGFKFGSKHSEETIIKMKKNPNCGGLRKGSGRGKSGWYKGIWCDSTWELAWVIYHLDNKIEFKRYEGFFEYYYENECKRYYPDFELKDGTIIEIKGYFTKKDYEKIKVVKNSCKKIQVFEKKDMKDIFNFVIEKYKVKELSTLYENSTKNDIIKRKTWEEYSNERKLKKELNIEKKKEKIRNSNIDFHSYGWGKLLGKYMNMSSQKAIKFVKDYMIDELNPRLSHNKRNSQHGTMWITNGKENKKIKKDIKIPEGWSKGRIFNGDIAQ